MRIALSIFFLLLSSLLQAQPVKLELGMKRNAVQTLMGKAKIDSYEKAKTVYIYKDSVFFTIEFDENELCKGFYWEGKNNDVTLIKTMEANGFTTQDTFRFTAIGFPGLFEKERNDWRHPSEVYTFIATTGVERNQKKNSQSAYDIPKEKPFYGFTILGMKVWEKESH